MFLYVPQVVSAIADAFAADSSLFDRVVVSSFYPEPLYQVSHCLPFLLLSGAMLVVIVKCVVGIHFNTRNFLTNSLSFGNGIS